MKLTLHEEGRKIIKGRLGSGSVHTYYVGGLPPGDKAQISHFDHGWRFLHWNETSHGNWSGFYVTPEAALEALREELETAVA
jgi:hypothetical protein